MLRLSVTARGGTMEKRAKVTRLVLEHVARADDAVRNFRDNGVSSEGLLMHPPLQAAALKGAREELQKAIGLIERTKWLADRRRRPPIFPGKKSEVSNAAVCLSSGK